MKKQLTIASLMLALLLCLVFWTAGLSGATALEPPAPAAPDVPRPLETPELAAIEGAELLRLPSGAVGPGIYIQFDEPTHNLDPAHGYPVAGGHIRPGWDTLEPNFDGDYRFDQVILPWVQQEAARGKKVAIGFTTYNGRGSGPDVGIKVPGWLWARDANVRLYNTRSNDGWYLLNYLNRTYVDEYRELLQAFANWVAGNATVRNALAWVEIGTGQWGENQPARKFGTDNIDWQYYAYNAPGGSNPSGGWSATDWINHVNEISSIYRNAFNAVGMNSLPILTNIAPTFQAGWERDSVSDYGVSIGVGLKHAGLLPDHNNAGNSYAPILKWWDSATNAVPISWEVYGKGWGLTEADWYWMVLCGLDKHPDNFLATRDLLTEASYLPSTRIAAEYCGVSIQTTPGVWIALRETFRLDRWDVPERGNFEFWLYQDDYSMGRTVTETYRNDSITANLTNRLGLPIYNPALGSFKEGWTTRRTSQGDGNPYMWFKIDDRYIYGGPTQVTIKVIYFDIGLDKWTLRYDAMSGEKDATPNGSDNAWVQKSNSRTWKTATFSISDGRFRNSLVGAHDFRIDCQSDGDEWIHFVEVRKTGSSAPTPTPTFSPTPLITPSPTPTTPSGAVQIPLYKGPNLVAYNGERKPVAEALASIDGLYSAVYSAVYEYDSGEGRYKLVWKQYIVGAPPYANTLTHLEPWRGYWIYVAQDCVWTVNR